MSTTNPQASLPAADFHEVIKSRRSVRKYDPDFKLTDEEIKELLTTATLAPSGSNMQPWRFIVITDSELKQKLLPIAFNQEQVVAASAVIAVLVDLQAYTEAPRIYGKAVEAGYMNEETAAKLVENMNRFYGSLPQERALQSALIDGGLVSQQLMLAARARGLDTVPMAGYNVDQFRELLQISDRYANVMLIALGKAAQPGHPTVRLHVDEITHWNGFNV
ncbi:nitroreductase family protein [Paenibacillus sp. FSL W8-1187]|uniref:Oxygen-insensitive NAD(P)H nitroreductase n=1 Tax=Paenibacillus pasadenensis TaxID=217090 RepID=A0A2N5N4G5_9BACL|nr:MULTISPECIES: nitroreductase family protein [Paenibacillus]PLT45223.1 Oxygen-insensitive NAD(P)H nitroreductase [Paenibacillus pasadenensis]QGG55611.1 nitroreductase family protein [Paenibacillus sp. B01]